MKRDLEALTRELHDVVIVGGGIYGVCVAREAALRGLSACLLERGDFGGQTSSQSLRIVHGGLRYLQHLDLPRVRSHIAERSTLLRIAPHLVLPLRCVIPTFGHGLRGKEAFRAALLLNDLAGFDRNRGLDAAHAIGGGRVLSRGELESACPGIPMDGVSGGAEWWDAQVWSSERLLLAFLESALRAGARAASYVEAKGPLGGRALAGVRARDALGGRELEVRGRVVVNAAGPWVDGFLSTIEGIGSAQRFRPSKAMNLVVRRELFPGAAVGVPGTAEFRDRDALVERGARMLFVVPWRGISLIGTKHVPYRGGPDDFKIGEQDVDAFLAEINAALPAARLTRADVVAVQGGMLPEQPGGGDEVQLEKHHALVDHSREDGIEGLVTLVGVKWTTARAVACEAIDLVERKLGRAGGARRDTLPVAGGDIPDLVRFLEEGAAAAPRSVPRDSVEHVLRSHGTGAREIWKRVEANPELARPICDRSPVIGAQVVHAAAREMAQSLDDVLRRRTDLWLAAPLSSDELGRCAALLESALGIPRG